MKKHELIALLKDVPDNADVRLWNGLVQDVVDIDKSITPLTLTKMSFNEMLKRCFYEDVARNGRDKNSPYDEDEIASIRKMWLANYTYELDGFVGQDDIKAGLYKKKDVYVLHAKIKGSTYYDHLGSVRY